MSEAKATALSLPRMASRFPAISFLSVYEQRIINYTVGSQDLVTF